MALTKPKILYFIGQSRPTNYDQQLAATVGGRVAFRDINKYNDESTPEECDGVMGVGTPTIYADKPTADEAVTAYRDALKAASQPATPAAPVVPAAPAPAVMPPDATPAPAAPAMPPPAAPAAPAMPPPAAPPAAPAPAAPTPATPPTS